MDWLSLLLATAVASLVILVPGAALGVALGMRGLRLAAVSVPAGVTVIAVAATAAPWLRLSWGLIPIAIVTLALGAVLVALRFAFWRGAPLRDTAPMPKSVVLALLGAVAVVATQFIVVVGSPTNFSQTFDNIFHLNAIRFVLDTGTASPLDITRLTSGMSADPSFYPSAWHATVALVAQLTDVAIPIASNAVMLFFGALSWPLSIVLLVRSLWGVNGFRLLAAAALSTGIPAFPILMIDYGVLFPYMMSLSMLATTLSLVVDVVAKRPSRERWLLFLALLGTLPALVVAHPGGFVAAIAFSSAILLVWWIGALTQASPRVRVNLVAGAVVYAVVAGGAWYVLRPVAEARTWTTSETMGQAIGEVLTASPWHGPVNVTIMVLAMIGVVTGVRRRSSGDWFALLLFAVAGVLYVTVSGLPYWLPRDILTGAWYNNAHRLAALLPFAWVPLGALGAERCWEWVQRRLAQRRDSSTLRIAALVAVVTVLVALPQVTVMRQAVASAHGSFALDDESPLLTRDEYSLLQRLPAEVPKDAVIVGSPWTGTALAYALEGRRVLLPHTLMVLQPGMSEILDGLRSATADSPACEAARELDVEYVLDFGDQEVNEGVHDYPGLDRLTTSHAVELVDSEGTVRLYRIIAC